jgi:acyl dehydratase
MSGARPRVGDAAPPLEKTAGPADLVAYAGATWDWHRIHYDAEFVAAKRLPAPIVDGQVYGAWFVQLLQDWLGPQCFVRTLEFSFRNLMFAGETLRCEGTVTSVGDDEVTLDLTATIVGRDGAADRVAAAPARAVVLLGTADGPAA